MDTVGVHFLHLIKAETDFFFFLLTAPKCSGPLPTSVCVTKPHGISITGQSCLPEATPASFVLPVLAAHT